MSPRESYPIFFDQLDISPLLRAVSKKALLGAPTRLNYSAKIYSLFIRVIERIPTIKDLRKRLKNSLEFRFDYGFTMADLVPSEASYTRMIQNIHASSALANIQNEMVSQAFKEGFIEGDVVAIDATHIEARDRFPEKKKDEKAQDKPSPKKRGRELKVKREKWLKEQQEREENQPLFEKKIEAQLPLDFTTIEQQIPQVPRWGIKKNSKGKNVFWFGFTSLQALAHICYVQEVISVHLIWLETEMKYSVSSNASVRE